LTAEYKGNLKDFQNGFANLNIIDEALFENAPYSPLRLAAS